MLLVTIESKKRRNFSLLKLYSDYRQAWIALGDMTKEKAMEEYIKLLLDRCAMFRTYIETQHVENEENDRLR
jgi:acyl-CoA-binding protein